MAALDVPDAFDGRASATAAGRARVLRRAFVSPPAVWTMAWSVVTACIVLLSMRLSDGHLVYTLDDPYIHLAVAENIIRGGYGVNLMEYASPSSSVIFPLMLAGTELLGLGAAGPLVLNVAATALSVYLLIGFAYRWLPAARGGSPLFFLVLCPLLLLAINAFGLPMTGMEHSWHVLFVLLTFAGLVRVAEGGRTGLSLVAAIVLLPLIRFEGIALAAAAVGALAWLGRWRPAGIAAVLIAASLLTYAATMSALGLPALPSSVLTKSAVASSVDGGGILAIVGALVRNLLNSFDERQGAMLLLSLAALWAGLHPHRPGFFRSPGFVIAAVGTLAIGAHLAAGRYGWFGRYEVYAVAVAIVAVASVNRDALARAVRERRIPAQAAILVAAGAMAAPYLHTTLLTPFAARGIYEQQYQMHRFATEFMHGNVAVNDLGLVSYRNDAFVLDLWGLGSEVVRAARATGRYDADVVARLAGERQIDLAMVYESWLGGVLPKHWKKIAVLEAQAVSAAEGAVAFFATSEAAVPALRDDLARFAATLPSRVRLTLLEP